MDISEVYRSLGQEGFAQLIRGISIGKLRTYQIYEGFKVRAHLHKVNTEALRKSTPRFWDRIMGGDEEFNYRSLQAMFQHAYNVCHIKDREANDQGKELRVDLKKCFDILKASDYRGYCSIEYDSPGEPYAPTAELIEQTVKYLS